MSPLFTPFSLRGLTLPNRIVISPMCQYSAIAGQADLVALARGVLYDPHWPWHAAAELGATVAAPRQYWRCAPPPHQRLFGNAPAG